MAFDHKCFELAEYFYPTADEDALNELSQRLQETIEDFDPETWDEDEEEDEEDDETETAAKSKP